jgi:hypothetical protein
MAHNHIRCKAEGPELCQQASPGSRLSELIMVKTGYTSAPLLVIVDVNIIKHCRKYFKPKFYKMSIEVNAFFTEKKLIRYACVNLSKNNKTSTTRNSN